MPTRSLSAPLLRWRSDKRLKIVAVSRFDIALIRAAPEVGQVIDSQRKRTGFLDRDAHLRALRGESSIYLVKLFHRTFEIRVAPRRDGRGAILGARGTLRLLLATPPPPPADVTDPALNRQKVALRSTISALELARTVADTARLKAETRMRKASEERQGAETALRRLAAEERRARLLVDATAVLDQAFEQDDVLSRLATLLSSRFCDWCVIYLSGEGMLRRVAQACREESLRDTLEAAFPARVEAKGFHAVPMQLQEIYSVVSPADFSRIAPDPRRADALKASGLQSFLRTPLKAHGRVSGSLLLGSNDSGTGFELADLKMAEDLAYRISLTEESTRLFAEAQRELALRREAEAKLRAFNAELESRVAERTQLLQESIREANSFAYTVAHDLRAPLRAMTGFCEALQDDYSATIDPVGRDYLDRIVSGAHKMSDLIRDLLDYARLNRAELTLEPVDLDELVGAVLQTMDAELRSRDAQVTREKLGSVVGHAPVLAQVFTNLISNAVKFVPPGRRPELRLHAVRRGRLRRVLVEDNGIGIATEHHERIFGIFERLNRSEDFPGTGIGLAIVRRACERLGGVVGLESDPGKGSQFWVELPIP